jgi:lipid II:glycine glycyltransferase (peptidoglycan interpeptide bridge formation enzyme)
MSKHWDGLILKDYESVMPLTWNKKFGICYLYQPSFAANLGIFGKNVHEETVKLFFQSIPQKFKLIEISLNSANLSMTDSPHIVSRVNYILSLRKNYHDLHKNYRENHQRNIQRAVQSGCIVKTNISVDEVIALNKAQMKDKVPITQNDYDRFKRLYQLLRETNKAVVYGVNDPQNKLLTSCVFFYFQKRAYYILAGNHPDSRNTGASHALIDAFIKDHAGEDLVLDFEGSDIETLALFYSGFGATREIYPAVRWNRLPWYLKWLK